MLHFGASAINGESIKGKPLNIAVHIRHIFLVKTFLEKGANPNVKNTKGNTVLHELFETFERKVTKSVKIAKILIENGSNP